MEEFKASWMQVQCMQHETGDVGRDHVMQGLEGHIEELVFIP